MQKIIYSIVLGTVLLLAGCNKFTDITPKGRNILNRVSDLDILLNFNFVNTSSSQYFKFDETTTLTDGYPYATSVPTILSTPTKSLNYALLAYDESVDRVTLAATDIKYEQLYSIINNVANIVLLNADNASGDKAKAGQLKAEAYVLRAYLHFILVNLYAKAYNPATADKMAAFPM
jgi:hypothetical protein